MESEIEIKPIAMKEATLEEVAEVMSPKISENSSEPEEQEDLSDWERMLLIFVFSATLVGIYEGLKMLGWF